MSVLPYTPQDPNFETKVRALFPGAAFVAHLGVEVLEVSPGECVTTLSVRPEHAQQHGFVHAGVVATMADHTAGAAAGTLVKPDEAILTVEFKINLLRPARGPSLRCVARVLRPGRTLSVVESEVWNDEVLVAKATVTLAVVAESRVA